MINKRVVSFFFALIFSLLVIGYLLIPKPPLLKGIPFSQAVYSEQHHLLRLTRASDGQYRLFTPLNKISPLLIKGDLLQEDQYFYYHPGINPFALVRAAWETFVIGKRRYGASTITMQLARIRFHLKTNSIVGKLEQIARAIQLERHYSKKEILQAYLNLAPYGGNVAGVNAASLIYFGRAADSLSLPEALTLSVIPQNPMKRRPTYHENAQLKQARDRLFQRWLRHYPQARQQQILFNLPLQTKSTKQLPFLAGHFTDQVLRDHPQQRSINTTLNLSLQELLQREIHAYIRQHQSEGINNAAAILVDTRNMAVCALVGSGDFFNAKIEGQVNGTLAHRSPGSSLKPFIYALAIAQGLITSMTVLKDAPKDFGSYDPENFDNRFIGPIHARDALVMSRNIPAVSLDEQLNQPTLYQFLKSAGVRLTKPEDNYGLSLALGGGEITMQRLATLYAMLANGGVLKPLRFVEVAKNSTIKRLFSREASFITLSMLSHNPPPATIPDALRIRKRLPVAWKTGTSSGYRDAWSVGVFGPYVLVVWLGNFSGQGNPALVGRRIAAPLFFSIVQSIESQQDLQTTRGLNPAGLNVKKVSVCAASGKLSTLYCPQKIKTWFIPGVSPIKTDTVYRAIAIDPKTGLRSCHITATTKFKVYEFWSSELLQLFRLAGIPRQLPPPYELGCSLSAINPNGQAPQITSPLQKVRYTISANQNKIPLAAIVDADVRTLYWFVNQQFLGKTNARQSLLWLAHPGKFTIRIVDDKGRSAVRTVEIVKAPQGTVAREQKM